MQKILMILICMFIGSAHATEMCAKNDTVVIPLDATVAMTTERGSNPVEWIWWAGFPYGKIYGAATCLSEAEVANLLPSDSDELIGRSGTDADGNIRGRCYCKITHPMDSQWVFDYNLGAGCTANLCPRSCWEDFGLDRRRIIFNTIGASMAETE